MSNEPATTDTGPHAAAPMSSLMEAEGIDVGGPAPGAPPARRAHASARARFNAGARRLLHRLRRDEQMRWVRRVGGLAAVLGLLLGGAWAVKSLIPHPTPDFLNDDFGEVLTFTLLTDDFNKLPLDERMRLLKDLVQRMKTMSEDDAPVMAAFAASLKQEMKKQMETNVKKLAADMIDNYAKNYAAVLPQDEAAFLDDSIIGFTELMEDVAGERSPLPRDPKERLNVIKEQAKKDEAKLREDKSRLTADRAARFFEFVHSDQQTVSDPQQRGRSAKFMRDMTRHLRGQDPSTGKPRPGGG